MNTITTYSHQPWNKGKLVGQKAPPRLRDDLANFLAGLEESNAKTFPAGKLAPCAESGEPKTLSHILKGGEACTGLR